MGIRGHSVWPPTINPPVVIITSPDGEYDDDFGDGMTHHMIATVLLQLGKLEVAQEQMDGYIAPDGDSSVRAAVEADPTFGGTANSATVSAYREYGIMRVGADEDGRGAEYLGCKFPIEVLA